MGFEWSYWSLGRAYAAGVQEYEVEQAMRGAWPRPATVDIGLMVLVFWGRTEAGRGLLIVTRQVGQWDREYIDVRELTSAEDAELAQWEKGR